MTDSTRQAEDVVRQPSDNGLAAELRGFGPIGIAAMLLILLTGNVFVGSIVLPDNASTTASYKPDELGGVVIIDVVGSGFKPSADGGGVVTKPRMIRAIPYFAWANRGEGEMRVWIPRKVNKVIVK